MTKKRIISANQFLAESLDEEASKLPPSKAEVATILRDVASLYRSRPGSKMFRLVEVDEADQGDA